MIPSTPPVPVQGDGTPYGTLGRLPIELRNEIYTYLLGKCWNLVHPGPDEISQDLGIMAASKSISSEAQEVFYAESVFVVDACQLFDNTDTIVPADRFINAQRMRCLRLRTYFEDLFFAVWVKAEDRSSAIQDGCNYLNINSYLVSLLDRGAANQEFCLQLDTSFESHDTGTSYDLFSREWVSTCKALCRLPKVTVEWLHIVYDETSEDDRTLESCPYFRMLNDQLQSWLGPSELEENHDKRIPCSSILKFRPREHQAQL